MLYVGGGGAVVVRWIFSFCAIFVLVQKGAVCTAQDIVSPPAIDIIPYADYYAQDNLVNEPYLSYFQGYINDMSLMDNYVIYVTQESKYVSGQTRYVTVYNCAIGSLTYNGLSFSGDVTIYKIYSNSSYFPQFKTIIDNNFTITPGESLVYTDLDSPYPDISDSKFQKYLFWLVVSIVIFYTISKFFRR